MFILLLASFMLLLTPKTTGVYTQTLATLPHVAICQLPQQQLPTKFPPYLPFKSKSFDVITTRTLYKFLANTNRSRNPEPRSWVREIHRILDKGGHFEFFFFDCQLSHAGPLTREMEPCLYQDHQFCGCRQIYEACTCSPATPTSEAMTGAQFLELLASEGFIMEKSTILMFPFSFLSQIFTQDGQRLKVNQEDPRSGQSNATPLLASLMKMIDEECRASQTAWRCIIGSAQKRKY
jgi:SAM-dependent methyltransferase